MNFTLATGWIAPNGQYYSCYPWDHDKVIINILQDLGYQNPSVVMAERLGFIRVTGRNDTPFLNNDNPTQSQIDTMYEYKLKYKK